MASPDMSQMFNTPLNEGEQFLFKQWQMKNPGLGNPYDYDAQGFWKGGNAAAANGHGSDQFKKPNHPTFSDQSQYSGQGTGYYGGHWGEAGGRDTFSQTPQNARMVNPLALGAYFNQYEPGNRLLNPTYAPEPPARISPMSSTPQHDPLGKAVLGLFGMTPSSVSQGSTGRGGMGFPPVATTPLTPVNSQVRSSTPEPAPFSGPPTPQPWRW